MARRTLAHEGLRIQLADTFLSRLQGLLGRRGLAHDEGLLITPCASVHTLGMRFPIDVVFLDKRARVQAIHEHLGPWRMAAHRRSAAVLELAAGACRAHRIAVGDTLAGLQAALN